MIAKKQNRTKQKFVPQHTFDEIRVQHLGLFKFEDGVLGVTCPEVDICQAHQEIHVVP